MGVPRSRCSSAISAQSGLPRASGITIVFVTLAESSKHCGSIVNRRTVIRPAYCPFCRNPNRKPGARMRMRSWERDVDTIKHIKEEEIKHTYLATCCGVVLATERNLDCHLADVHGYTM